MPKSYGECPECGHREIEEWTEEVEYGHPTNLHSRGAEAPNYKTKPITRAYCPECDWDNGNF